MSIQNLFVVSNRLPITITRSTEKNQWVFTKSSGGLVAALNGLQQKFKFVWFGWPGTNLLSISCRNRSARVGKGLHKNRAIRKV